jgi:hypothetical protein
MENIILQKTRYLKAMMLTMLVGLFAFSGYAQTFTNVVAPDDALTHYATRDSLVTFDAAPNLTGGTVYLYHGAFIEDNVLGTSNVAAGQTINFTWPDADAFPYNLKLVEATGTFNTVVETIPNNELTVIGTTDTDYFFNFDQSGGRSVTTSSYDLTGETVRLNVAINVIPANLTDSLIVAYSTNGSTYNDLDTIGSDGNYFYDLPAGAISASTSFRILQRNSGSIADGVDTWRLDDLSLEFGDAMNADFGNEVSLGNFNVDLSDITIADILNDQDVSIGGGALYPRDTITLVANYNGFQPADYQYVAYFTDAVESTVYQLDGQTLDTSNPGEIRITGSIPLNVEYNQNWDFFIKAYDNAESSAVIGQNLSVNLRDGVVSGGGPTITMSGGTQFVETALFLDPGGFGNYFNNEDVTQTFYPNDGSAKLRADFTSFDVEGCPWDYLYIYDGTSTAAPLIGAFNECNPVTSVQATNPSGALTFRFTTDGSVTYSGWQANISSVFEGDVASIEGGQTFGNEIGFFEDGARSVTTLPFSLNSDNAVITFDLRRDNNVISPDGTEIVLEYSTDGSTFTELAGISLNEMTTVYQTFQVDEWPAGVASSSTQFRFRQLSNNGEDLNSWSIRNIFIDVNSNLINGGVFDYFSYGSNQINSPIINLEVYDILANGQVFPGSQITLNYEVLDGAFPAGTEIDGIFDRNDALGYEYSIGSSASVGSTINVTIPAVGTGTYPIYLETSNGVTSNNLNLQVSGLSLQVDSIIGTPNVRFQGNDVYYPGSDVEVFYTLTGTPGSGANLLFEVEDNISGEYVTIGTANTFTGSITANLPDSIDYSGNYQLSVSTGQPLVAGGDTDLFNPTINYGGNFSDATDAEPWMDLQGYEFGNSFSGSGVRSATTEAFEIPNGARVQIQIGEDDDFSGSFDVILQASIDGSTWIGLDTATLAFDGDSYFFNELLPTSVWSETTQFRVISNEDEAFGYNENTFDLESLQLTVPNTQAFALATGTLDIVFPTLAVEDLDPNWVVGQDIAIDFNMTGPFPANTYVAAIIENAGTGDFELIGETAAVEVGEITGTLPLMTETEAGDPYNQIKLVPYIKADANTNYEQGNNIPVQVEEDFLVVEGDDNPAFDPENFFLDQAGNRSVLTRAYDLSGVSTAFIQFNYSDIDGDFDMNGNENIVPRLQVSVDAGATFQEIPINDVNEEVGLLYEGQFYTVEVPSEYLTEATHFRWVQPLNLGEGTNRWSLNNIDVILGGINALQTSYNTVNNIQGITLGNPSLNGYAWAQANLSDAVFNGESFDYSWSLADGFASEDVDAFPAGTEFIFTLIGELDPQTEQDLVIDTTSTLGTFSGEVPFFVTNGTYDVGLIARVMVGEEYVYFHGDEDGNGTNVGSLDVFLRVARLTYEGDPNATIYAGQTVTFGIDFENNETFDGSGESLFANLIFDSNQGDVVLATQEGLGDISIDLPTDFSGLGDFRIELSENAPIADVGTLLENPTFLNLEGDASENFLAGQEGLIYFESNLFYESQIGYPSSAAAYFNYSYLQASAQQLRLEYSLNFGPYQSLANLGPTNGNFTGYTLPNQMRDQAGNDNIRFRWVLSAEEYDGSNVSVSDFYVRNFNNNQNYFFNVQGSDPYQIFPDVSGRRLITTRNFTSEELMDATLFGFNASFDQMPSDLTESQYVIFEYSTDGGATYTELEAIPEMDAEMAVNNDRFTLGITQDMKDNGVRFRWRQEEAKGNFGLFNVDIIKGETLPFEYVAVDNLPIAPQALIIDAVSATEGCLDANVTLDYTIRGRFGADNIVTVDYSDVNGLNNPNPIDGYEFNVTEGSGQVTFAFAGNTLSQFDDNANYKFRLSANDETTDNTVNVDGAYSETSYELVAPVNTDATFTVLNDPLSCSPEDVMVSINAGSMQDYFLYEILNAADGTVLGSLERDPEDYQNEINIGTISAATDLTLRISSQSSQGNVCNTLEVDEESVEVLQNFELYSYANPDQDWKLVNAGAELSTCQFAGEVDLRVYRALSDGSKTTTGVDLVEWFRDDLNNPVATGTTLTDGDMEFSGSYFARVTTGSCVYQTEAIQINVEQAPDQPTITVVSGDLAACSSADPVVLEAPAGFEYYSWSNGATSRSISVEESGTFTVQVSNLPFGIGCASPTSASVSVDRYETPEVSLRLGTSPASPLIADGSVMEVCDNEVVYFFEDNTYGNSGIIEVLKDGVSFETLEGNNNYTIDESGIYSFVWNFDGINVSGCTAASVEFTMNVFETPTTAPVLTSTGDLNFCEGQGTVTLEAPAGFEYYNWFRSGVQMNTPNNGFANSNIIEVSTSGNYTVEVANLNGCESPESNEIQVNVVAEPNLPNGFFQVNTTCGEGVAEFNITNNNNANNAMTYQLYNGETGEASGNPVTIQGGQSGSIFTDVLTEDGIPFYVEVMYADGTGCSFVDPSITTNASIRTITLEVQGASLIANYPGSNSEVRWYRNEVLLTNATGNSITITDAAEYTVEVEYNDGCILTASSADIAGKVLANREGMDMQVTSYPNPTLSDVTLNVNSQYMGKHEVIITSMTGQIMLQSSFEKSSFEAKHAMDVANLQEGIYNVQIRHNGLTQNVRIIKK